MSKGSVRGMFAFRVAVLAVLVRTVYKHRAAGCAAHIMIKETAVYMVWLAKVL
jgi:hypothetical protein